MAGVVHTGPYGETHQIFVRHLTVTITLSLTLNP